MVTVLLFKHSMASMLAFDSSGQFVYLDQYFGLRGLHTSIECEPLPAL